MKSVALKNSLLFVAVIIIAISGIIRLTQIANYNFPFTTDQARDMLDLRQIVIGLNPTLVGPTTSINGVFLGPSYYYFNIVPFFLGQGDPAFLVYWNLGFYLLAAFLLLFLHRKNEISFGFFASILFITAPGYFQNTRYFWNSHSMVYFALFYFISLYFFLRNPSAKKALLLGLTAGIAMQFQAAFGILLLPFALILSFIYFKKIGFKLIGLTILSFSLTLLPQVLFELKNKFVMTKIFLAEVTGTGAVLGEKMTFPEAILSHLNSFIFFSHGILALPFNLDSILLIGAIIFLSLKIYQKKLDSDLQIYTFISIGFLIFAFIFYSFYLHELKDWFILSLRIPYIILIATFFTAVYNHSLKNSFNSSFLTKNNFFQHLPKTITVGIIMISVFLAFADQKQFIPKNSQIRSADKSNLRNSIEAIDWVYEHTNNKGFKAYNYIPSVYDFPYQYLYWWYGTKKYGYQPETISYKEGVPEYIPHNTDFLTKTRPQEEQLIALIYEDDSSMDRLFGWGGNFTDYCRKTDIKYSWGTTAEIRQPCQPGENSPRLEPAKR